MDETEDPKPHPHLTRKERGTEVAGASAPRRRELSIWFFCGILMLAYGVVLVAQGAIEYNHPPANELLLPWLERLHPTLWWGVVLGVFGGFYTVRFRPGKG